MVHSACVSHNDYCFDALPYNNITVQVHDHALGTWFYSLFSWASVMKAESGSSGVGGSTVLHVGAINASCSFALSSAVWITALKLAGRFLDCFHNLKMTSKIMW